MHACLPVLSAEPVKEGVSGGDRAEAAALQRVAVAALADAELCRDGGVHCEGAWPLCVLAVWAAGVSADCGRHKC